MPSPTVPCSSACRLPPINSYFPFLGLLPPPTDGWSDITDIYKARYGEPKPGTAIWIRTCQHIDGWTDAPKVTHDRVRAPAS